MNRIVRHRILAVIMLIAAIAFLTLGAAPGYANDVSNTIYQDAAGYWSFDDGSGNVADDSISTHNGTLVNMAPSNWVSGNVGGALRFNGSNQYITTGFYPQTGSPFTVGAWFKTSGSADYQLIADQWGNPGGGYAAWILLIEPGTGKVKAVGYDGGSSNEAGTAGSYVDGAWHYAAYVYDGTNVTLYVDGASKDSIAQHVQTSTQYPMFIGRDSNPAGGGYVNGLIDEVAVWNEALTTDEIDALHKTGRISDAVKAGGSLDLDYTTDQINQLAYLYKQKSGLLTIGGISWQYDGAIPGIHGIDGDGGTYDILLGDSGGVPEPAAALGLISAIFMLASRRVFKRKRS